MGQYFIPTFLDAHGRIVRALNPSDYGSGDKIAGHSRADTRLMWAVEALLALDGGFRLVWAGEYADDEADQTANLYWLSEPRHFVRFRELICPEPGVEANASLPQHNPHKIHGFVCNADRREFIDKSSLPVDDMGWRRTSLPNLTFESNRPGNGRWARDRLHYSHTPPPADWTPAPVFTWT
jgi:hypothetical protein